MEIIAKKLQKFQIASFIVKQIQVLVAHNVSRIIFQMEQIAENVKITS